MKKVNNIRKIKFVSIKLKNVKNTLEIFKYNKEVN